MEKITIYQEEDYVSLLNDTEIHSTVEELVIHWQDLKELPGKIANFINLKRLNLSVTRTSKISPKIGELTLLEDLDLNCMIKEVPDTIGNLLNLKHLKLFGEYKDIPNSIFNLPKLEALYLYGNKFEEISNSIEKLKILKILGINGENLKEIPNRHVRH